MGLVTLLLLLLSMNIPHIIMCSLAYISNCGHDEDDDDNRMIMMVTMMRMILILMVMIMKS